MTAEAINTEDDQVFKVGMFAALALALLLIAGIFLPLDSGGLPGSGAGWLTYLHGSTGFWSVIIGLSVLSDLLFVPVALALYALLAPAHRGLMLLAGGCVALFVLTDLSVTWTSYAALLRLSGGAAGDPGVAAGADRAATVLGSPLDAVFSCVLIALAVGLISLAMLRHASFGKKSAVLGLIAAAAGFFAVSGWTVTTVIDARVTAGWLLIVAGRLYTLRRDARRAADAVAR